MIKLDKVTNLINEEEILDILKSLIRVPGHVDYKGQEKEISIQTLGILEKEKIYAELQEVEPGRKNVIGRIHGKNKGKSLVLNGHLDTVPPNGSMKSYEPSISNGKLYGLGSSDMKGAVAAMLYSLILIKRAGVELDGDLYFTGVIGEESGGTGTRFLINSGFKPDYAVVGEPTSLSIANSHKGCFLADVTIEGKAAHASIPQKGANAIAAMGNFICKINKEYIPELNKRIQENAGSPTISFGIIRGGKKVNIVADHCVLNIDRRWIASESKEQVIPELEKYLKDVCSENKDLKYSIVPALPQEGYFGPFFIPESHELVKMSKEAVMFSGRKPEVTSMNGWTDGATILHAGIPTVILGPGNMEQAHTADEWINISELIDSVKVYLSLIFQICINK
jgi:acetylornithine deacetylase/succinyl-diaminopimelate desuccinylase family protein